MRDDTVAPMIAVLVGFIESDKSDMAIIEAKAKLSELADPIGDSDLAQLKTELAGALSAVRANHNRHLTALDTKEEANRSLLSTQKTDSSAKMQRAVIDLCIVWRTFLASDGTDADLVTATSGLRAVLASHGEISGSEPATQLNGLLAEIRNFHQRKLAYADRVNAATGLISAFRKLGAFEA